MPDQGSPNLEATLQVAIQDLDLFTRSETSRLEVGEDGHLVAAQESRLERMVGLARCYIGPMFSDQAKKKLEQKLIDLKKAIFRARDFIQSHSGLIDKFKEGNPAQRKLAELAVVTIQRYNAIVEQKPVDQHKADVYNYERQRLLLDNEIKGQPIELPHVVSIKYDSHPQAAHSAHKMLKELSQVLSNETTKKNYSSISPTHKKSLQFMIDTFQMKVIRMIETHLHKSVAEIVPLVKQAMPEIDEESHPELINMQQLIEVDAGSVVLVTGCFKRNHSTSKFMTMPILDSFRLSFQLTHTGFPYPSQHTGWALADKWIDAAPLRMHQTPLFQQVDQRRKRLAHQLLFDQEFSQKVRRHFKVKRLVFDQNRHLFLPFYRQLQRILHQRLMTSNENPCWETFYQELTCAPSAFDLLTQTQQQILDFFHKQPLKALEEEWLEAATSTPLRIGSPQEKFQAACLKLEQYSQQIQEQLDKTQNQYAYIVQQGHLLSGAIQSVGLQYQSERMRFCPPLLNEFARKLQACAFQQLLAFLDECEHGLEVVDPEQIKNDLLLAWSRDLQLLEAGREDDHAMPFAIVNELERYFTSRFQEGIK